MSALGDAIVALGEKSDKHTPYRNSKFGRTIEMHSIHTRTSTRCKNGILGVVQSCNCTRQEQYILVNGVMEYTRVCGASFGYLYLWLYAGGGNGYIIPPGVQREFQPLDFFQTNLFYAASFLAGDLEHEQDRRWPTSRVNEE